MAKSKKEIEAKFKADTSQFTEKVDAAGKEIFSLTKELKLNATQLKNDSKNVELLAQKQNLLSKESEASKNKIDALESKLDVAKKTFGENSKEVYKLKNQITDAKTQFAAIQNEIQDTNKKFNSLGDSADKSGNELEKTSKKAEKAKGGFTVLKGAISGLLVKGITALGSGIKSLVGNMGDMISSAASAGDEIDKQSQKMQISNETYQQLSYAANLCGTNINTIKKAQKSLQSSGSKLNIVDALNECADSSDAAAKATEMFGAKTAQELLPLLNQGSEGIKHMMNTASEYGMIMNDDAVAASAKYEDSLTTMTTTFDTVKNGLISNVLPGVTSVLDGFTGLMVGQDNAQDMIVSGVSDVIGSLQSVLPKFALLFDSIISSLNEIAPQIIETLISGVTAMLPKLGTLAITIIITVANSLLSQLPNILNAGIEILFGLINGITAAIPELFPLVISIVLDIADTLISNIPVLIDCAVNLFLAIVDAIPIIIPELVNQLPNIINAVLNALKSSIPKILLGAIDALSSIVKAIPTIAKSMFNAGKQMVSTFLESFNSIPESIGALFDKIKAKIKVPKISVSYSTDGVLGKVADAIGLPGFPKLNITWNKDGHFFTGKTLEVRGYAEAGDSEYALPLNKKTLDPLAAGIVNHMDAQTDMSDVISHIDALYNEVRTGNITIKDKFIDAVANRLAIKLNDREVGRVVRSY